MSDLPRIQNVRENLVGGRLLRISASKSSSALLSYTGWLMGGIGAVFGAILINVAEILPFIGIHRLKLAFGLFLIASGLHAFQLLLASGVNSGVAVGEETEKLGAESADLNMEIVLAEFGKGNTLFYRWIFHWSIRKLKSGDINFGNRFLLKISQWQGVIVLLQSALALLAVFIVVQGLNN